MTDQRVAFTPISPALPEIEGNPAHVDVFGPKDEDEYIAMGHPDPKTAMFETRQQFKEMARPVDD